MNRKSSSSAIPNTSLQGSLFMESYDYTARQGRNMFPSARHPLLKTMASCAGNVQFMAGVLFMLGMLDSAHATADFQKCCIMAARAKFTLYPASLPWDTCTSNAASGGLNPSVNATLAWCEQNCPGHEPSDTSEWLHPITTWIIPYVGLLLLCPTGERLQAAEDRLKRALPTGKWIQDWTRIIEKWMSNVFYRVLEYAGFLGDPASAIWGAFSELLEDWWLSRKVTGTKGLRRELIATVILAGQTEFNGQTHEQMTKYLVNGVLLNMSGPENSVVQGIYGSQDGISQDSKSDNISSAGGVLDLKTVKTTEVEKTPLKPLTMTELQQAFIKALDQKAEPQQDETDPFEEVAKAMMKMSELSDAPDYLSKHESTNQLRTNLEEMVRRYNGREMDKGRTPTLLAKHTFTFDLWHGIRLLLEARVDFINTILIPVILLLAVTASVFYDAYQSLGDSDTAHSLAYGLLYSWLIVLAVAGNCYTSSLSAGLLKETIGVVFPLSPNTVRLRERYTNALRWRRWLGSVGAIEPIEGDTRYVFRFLGGQMLGWVCVAIPASCAAAISYTTPTVGIGCRSFNHLLYALMSLIICLIPVLLYWNEVRKKDAYNNLITFFYNFLVFGNVLVLLGGTFFHLTGLFHSCWCMNMFVRSTRLLELNTNTAQAVHNATIYWLPVGYVTFVFIWFVCASAIVMRQYIGFNVNFLRHMTLQSVTLQERHGKTLHRD